MPHHFEPAATGRAKCRACGAAIAKGAWRLGEVVPNLYADADGAEAVHWYHAWCGAYRRPEAARAALDSASDGLPDRAALVAAADLGLALPRLSRLHEAGRAASGRAACRHCHAAIAKDTWRIGLLFWQDGRFSPAGFVHVACAGGYFETTALVDRLRYFTPGLTDADLAEIEAALIAPPAA